MKKAPSILCAALLLTGASSAFASSTDLTVTGVITPAACQPSLSSGGIVDYGKIPAKDLNLTTHTFLPVTTLQLAVVCDDPTTFAFQIKDHQQDSSPYPHTFFGIGKTPDSEDIGSYMIHLENPVADGNPTTEIYSLDNGSSWLDSAAIPVLPPSLTAFGDQSSGAWAPILITRLQAELQIKGQINPAQNLTVTGEVPITGSATIEMRYP